MISKSSVDTELPNLSLEVSDLVVVLDHCARPAAPLRILTLSSLISLVVSLQIPLLKRGRDAFQERYLELQKGPTIAVSSASLWPSITVIVPLPPERECIPA